MTATFLLFAILDLGVLFSEKDAWQESAAFFAVEHARDGFTFASEDRTIVNCLRHDTCTWHGLQVWETRVYFDRQSDEERIARVELSLYNRGDAKKQILSVDDLKKKLSVVAAKLDAPEKKPKTTKTTLGNGAVRYCRRFEKAVPTCELVWGLSALDANNDRNVDYLRLTLMPKGIESASRSAATKKPVGRAAKSKIKDNIVKSPNGDIYVDNVPMVDQGQKGYCAPAVAERVLRYYGNLIDEHEIAQQAGTTARCGTSVAEMKKTVTRIGEKNKLGFQAIVSMSAGVSELEDEISRYNKAAKAEKKAELSLAQFTRNRIIYVSEMREAMDKKVIYRMRQKDPRRKKFSTGIRQQINAGIPVFWGVTLGIYPERGVNPQATGGHMRLIIGYNEKKKEILYTDTWGAGHELKRMPEDWAFAITHDAFFLKPR